MSVLEAEYQNGVLHPTRPLRLRPGERVRLVVIRRTDPARWAPEKLSKVGDEEDVQLAEEGLSEWVAALEQEDRR